MTESQKIIYILMLLWGALSAIFIIWGGWSLVYLLKVQEWGVENPELIKLIPILHFGYLMSTIIWFVFSSVFLIITYGTLRRDQWVWSTGLIMSTIFLIVFGLMLTAFIINALVFFDQFSVLGLTTTIITFIIDLGIVFFLTRPKTKENFEIS